jgi:hypothetical protein
MELHLIWTVTNSSKESDPVLDSDLKRFSLANNDLLEQSLLLIDNIFIVFK